MKRQNCVICTQIYIVHIKTEDRNKDISEDVRKSFDTSNYEVDRPLPMGKNEKAVGLMKDEFGEKIKKNCWITTKKLQLFKRQ